MPNYIEASDFCDHCGRQVLVRKETPNHVLHLLLSLFCCGGWWIVWLILILASMSNDWYCTRCGRVTSRIGGAFTAAVITMLTIGGVMALLVFGVVSCVTFTSLRTPHDSPAHNEPRPQELKPDPQRPNEVAKKDPEKKEANGPAPNGGVPAKFKVGDRVIADGRAEGIWLGDNRNSSDEANRIEDKEGPAAARTYSEKHGGLRWVRHGIEGVVAETDSTHSLLRFDQLDGFKAGWVKNSLLKLSSREDEKDEPKTEPKKSSRPTEDTTAKRKAIYNRIIAALDQVESSALAKYGKERTIPRVAFVERETTKALDALAKELKMDRSVIDRIRAEGNAKEWPKK